MRDRTPSMLDWFWNTLRPLRPARPGRFTIRAMMRSEYLLVDGKGFCLSFFFLFFFLVLRHCTLLSLGNTARGDEGRCWVNAFRVLCVVVCCCCLCFTAAAVTKHTEICWTVCWTRRRWPKPRWIPQVGNFTHTPLLYHRKFKRGPEVGGWPQVRTRLQSHYTSPANDGRRFWLNWTEQWLATRFERTWTEATIWRDVTQTLSHPSPEMPYLQTVPIHQAWRWRWTISINQITFSTKKKERKTRLIQTRSWYPASGDRLLFFYDDEGRDEMFIPYLSALVLGYSFDTFHNTPVNLYVRYISNFCGRPQFGNNLWPKLTPEYLSNQGRSR